MRKMSEQQTPVPVKIINEQQDFTLGKSWGISILCLSFSLFFLWFPPLMIIFLLGLAIFLPFSVIWTIFKILKALGVSVSVKPFIQANRKLREKCGLWKRLTTPYFVYDKEAKKWVRNKT